jgi:selenocysteine lyase/cysteine desulfurase
MIMALLGKSSFPRAREVAYLDTAAEGLPMAESLSALGAYFRDKSMGSQGRHCLYQAEQAATVAAARLLGTAAENVALLSSASEAVNVLSHSLRWKLGDEVVTTDLEFPSNVLPWLALKERGVHLRIVQCDSGAPRLEQFVSLMGPSTRLVIVSLVSYKTGTRIPFLAELGREAHRVGAVFCVDATQALGRMPVSLEGVDYLVASSYKWLLGIHGLGIAYLSPELCERLAPETLGWYSIRDIFVPDRFERYELKPGAARLLCGMPNFPPMYVLRKSIQSLLELGPARIDEILRPLMNRLRIGVEELGLDLLTPTGTDYSSGIVSFAHSKAESIGAALEEMGVIVWAGDGRVRASVHLYNDADDIERCLSALKSALSRLEAPACPNR